MSVVDFPMRKIRLYLHKMFYETFIFLIILFRITKANVKLDVYTKT